MIALVANVAEILAATAILITALRAWPLLAEWRKNSSNPIDRTVIQDGLGTISKNIESSSTPSNLQDARNEILRFMLRRRADLIGVEVSFLLRGDDPSHPGEIIFLQPYSTPYSFGKLELSFYNKMVEDFKNWVGVDKDSSSGTARTLYSDEEGKNYNVLLHYATSVRGPIMNLQLIEEVEEISIDRLGFTDEQWKGIQSVLERKEGLIVFNGLAGSDKTFIMSRVADYLCNNGYVIAINENIFRIEKRIMQLEIGSQSAEDVLHAANHLNPDAIVVNAEINIDEIFLIWRWQRLVLTQTSHDRSVLAFKNLASELTSPLLSLPYPILIVTSVRAKRLCETCRTSKHLQDSDRNLIGDIADGLIDVDFEHIDFFVPGVGCENCRQGTKGGIGVFEVLKVDTNLVQMAAESRSVDDMERYAMENGLLSKLESSALHHAMAGHLSFDRFREIANPVTV